MGHPCGIAAGAQQRMCPRRNTGQEYSCGVDNGGIPLIITAIPGLTERHSCYLKIVHVTQSPTYQAIKR